MPGRVAVAGARAATRVKTTSPDDAAEVAKSAAAPAVGARARVWQTPVLRLTVALALGLLLTGIAGLEAASLLEGALRSPLPGDEASAVCDYLVSRDYDALAGEMDPAPVSGSTGPFDHDAFVSQLRALDARGGTVQTCALRQLGASGDGTTVLYTLTLRRTHVRDPLGSLVVVHRKPDGGWTVARSSTFYDAPE